MGVSPATRIVGGKAIECNMRSNTIVNSIKINVIINKGKIVIDKDLNKMIK